MVDFSTGGVMRCEANSSWKTSCLMAASWSLVLLYALFITMIGRPYLTYARRGRVRQNVRTAIAARGQVGS